MSKPLPPNPNLEYDKKQAKALLKAYQAGDAEAIERVRAAHPRLQNVPEKNIPPGQFMLSDAQLVIANEYGISSWPRLKHEIETIQAGLKEQFRQFADAVNQEDTARVRSLLEANPALAKHINDPGLSFDTPALVIAARRNNRALVDVLLEHGADVNAKSEWWAGAFTPLTNADPAMANYLISRGAQLDVFAAAEQNKLDDLRQIVEADPELVHAKGPDGQRALHFARSTEAIDYLLEKGAEINARDVDHCGTAAQFIVVDHPDLCRYLLERGAQPDIFMVCALGDRKLVETLLDADPDCINKRTGGDDYPPAPPAPGTHIYTFNLGGNLSPHQIARKYGHESVYQLLLERSSPQRRLVDAFERADVEAAHAILRDSPGMVASLPIQDQSLLADAVWRNDVPAVKAMLEAGFSPNARTWDGSSPLHRAAFHGFIEVMNLLLQYHPSLTEHNGHGAIPLETAIVGSVHSWRHDGDFPATVEALIKAGSKVRPDLIPSGNAGIDAVLRRYLPES